MILCIHELVDYNYDVKPYDNELFTFRKRLYHKNTPFFSIEPKYADLIEPYCAIKYYILTHTKAQCASKPACLGRGAVRGF